LLDPATRVVILAGADPHFSAGHDLKAKEKDQAGRDFPPVSVAAGYTEPGAAGLFARETEIYLDMIRRLRDCALPTIAQVQGRCIAGGLMLAWACDLIVASDDATFCDPTVAMGVCGVEWFVHPWELGSRKAKEMLFTGDTWTAADAKAVGMVNQVVPRADLPAAVVALACKIAAKPAFALKLAKSAVNAAIDAQGQPDAIRHAFALHHLCHAHNRDQFGSIVDPSGLAPAVRLG
jgi:enoyl-CoA hydratase